MPGRRTCQRVIQQAWAFPAILLSGVVMLITASLPATADPTAQVREHSAEASRELVGSTGLTSVGELPDAVANAGSAANKLGYAPPNSPGTDVDPLDRFVVQTWGGYSDALFVGSPQPATDPDRGPPLPGQR